MNFEAFCGPSYSPQSVIAESQACVNWYPERVESGKGKGQYTLYRSPGILEFADSLVASAVRGLFSLNGHVYAVVGSHIIEIFSDGTILDFSDRDGVYLTNDGLPVQMAANPTQLMITSGGDGYILATTIQEITDPDFPHGDAIGCAFLDGYFIVIIRASQQFQISALNNGLDWDALDISSVESRPDFVSAVLVDHQEVLFFGGQTLQVFYDSGNALFPLVPNQSGVVEQGIIAPASAAKADNSTFWLGGDAQGHGVVWRLNGYTPMRVSDHALETAMQSYDVVTDAIATVFQINGHTFYQLYFPDADVTWRLDVSSGQNNQWTQASWWNAALGVETAHRAQCSVAAFDKVLVGDRANGLIYEMHPRFLDDNGDAIRRRRRCPHLYADHKTVFYQEFELNGNMGIGLVVAEGVLGYEPMGMLRWSNDGGRTWSDDVQVSFGKTGEYSTRALWRCLGRGRDRVYEFTVTDPVDWCIAACRIEIEVGLN